MENTMLIQLTNKKALKLLQDMEDLDLIKVLKENVTTLNPRLSEKYRSVFTNEDAKSFTEPPKQCERNGTI